MMYQMDEHERAEDHHEELLKKCTKIKDKDFPTYLLPFEPIANKTGRYQLGEGKTGKDCLTVLLLGLKGSGKSMLLEVLGNYGLGVGLHDPHRFQMKKEGPTDEISSYTFFTRDRQRFPRPVTLIDTPGFHKGQPEEDQKLMDAICDFVCLHHKHGVNAVIFVVPSSQGRLTAEQTMVLRNFSKVLGNEESREISYLFCTFADSKRPPVLRSVMEAGLQFKKHFPVNCSAYFVKEEVDEEDDSSIEDTEEKGMETKTISINELLWKMTTERIHKFFENIKENRLVQARKRQGQAGGKEYGRKGVGVETGTSARKTAQADGEPISLRSSKSVESRHPTDEISSQSTGENSFSTYNRGINERGSAEHGGASPSQPILKEAKEKKNKRKLWMAEAPRRLFARFPHKNGKSGGDTARSTVGLQDREVPVNPVDKNDEFEVREGRPPSVIHQGETHGIQYMDPNERNPQQTKSPGIEGALTRPIEAKHINTADNFQEEEEFKLYALRLARILKSLHPESKKIARQEIENLLYRIEFGSRSPSNP
ncbi:unnamed protein product [Darwinula stevensoni]|uniref:G domain-containing protein n=1 Tax=Darwinula stevensoni TaxID=69355 RepID=A0A7R8XD82_9CRUS|nr:unnamed protein product [Darwinula stevensoni]CAG0892973.1 unnamed protein product [Darwinula stevensoni]